MQFLRSNLGPTFVFTKFLQTKNLLTKIFLSAKFYLDQTFFQTHIFELIFFLDQHFVCTNIFLPILCILWLNFLTIFLSAKFTLDQNCFWQFFFDYTQFDTHLWRITPNTYLSRQTEHRGQIMFSCLGVGQTNYIVILLITHVRV